ncbi:hypothetical protein NDN08_003827 [Rhodosorus marinus]|uniref:C2H2-type domain-containing protein n=1 Tax=Rhodosorus marinus TaxID=101924 RepID=A0AAV8UGL3_9RHOD|nr:hypothetical protein NDN08_003827 [Rhodosorus marinus]
MGGVKKNRAKRQKIKASRMIDAIKADLDDPKRAKELRDNQPVDVDLPGLGQFYCLECDKHFISGPALEKHKSGKPHKNRLRRFRDEPYTIEESVMASGQGSADRGIGKRAS